MAKKNLFAVFVFIFVVSMLMSAGAVMADSWATNMGRVRHRLPKN